MLSLWFAWNSLEKIRLVEIDKSLVGDGTQFEFLLLELLILGGDGQTRTADTRLMSPLLCHLSYVANLHQE
jgi:hypothetical protein